jgi:phosphate transport system substrate-binding protein
MLLIEISKTFASKRNVKKTKHRTNPLVAQRHFLKTTVVSALLLHIARKMSLALLALAVVGCNRVETPKVTPIPIRVRVAADDATAPLMRSLTQAFNRINPEYVFIFETGNVASVNEMLFEGKIDLASVSQLPESQNATLWIADLAVDGVAVIVNQANPIATLSTQNVREIFAGYRNEWADFGSNAGSIQTVVRENDDSSRAVFDASIMGDAQHTSSAIVMSTVETVINFVAVNPGAIGFVPSGRITASPQPNVKMVVIDGKSPTSDSLHAQTYAMHRALNLVALREPQTDVRKFAAWVLSDDGKRIAEALGYATIK